MSVIIGSLKFWASISIFLRLRQKAFGLGILNAVRIRTEASARNEVDGTAAPCELLGRSVVLETPVFAQGQHRGGHGALPDLYTMD